MTYLDVYGVVEEVHHEITPIPLKLLLVNEERLLSQCEDAKP